MVGFDQVTNTPPWTRIGSPDRFRVDDQVI